MIESRRRTETRHHPESVCRCSAVHRTVTAVATPQTQDLGHTPPASRGTTRRAGPAVASLGRQHRGPVRWSSGSPSARLALLPTVPLRAGAFSSSSSMSRAWAWLGSMTSRRACPAAAPPRSLAVEYTYASGGRRCRGARRRPRAAPAARTTGARCTPPLPARSTAPAWWDGASPACRHRGAGSSRGAAGTAHHDGVAVEHLHDTVPGVGRAPLLTEPPPQHRGGGPR